MPVSWLSVTIGIAMAPNATGAVSATRATTTAFIGLKPSAISITEQMATGVPNPASASSSAPNAKPMITAWTRSSELTALKDCRRIAKCPDSWVML